MKYILLGFAALLSLAVVVVLFGIFTVPNETELQQLEVEYQNEEIDTDNEEQEDFAEESEVLVREEFNVQGVVMQTTLYRSGRVTQEGGLMDVSLEGQLSEEEMVRVMNLLNASDVNTPVLNESEPGVLSESTYLIVVTTESGTVSHTGVNATLEELANIMTQAVR